MSIPGQTARKITDPATATPVDIDTEIARLEGEHLELQCQIAQRRTLLQMAQQAAAERREWRGESPETITAQMTHAFELVRQVTDQLAPLNTEYRSRPWTRYYLVDAHNGHVHSSTNCSTCFPTTDYYWLTSESGKTAEQVVDEAQSQACTVCFPWAPVTHKRGSYRTPSQAEAEQRAAERAEKAAKRKAAEITTPDGGELYAVNSHGTLGRFEREGQLRTDASAWRRAMRDTESLAYYGSDHPHAPGWTETINRCVAALAAHRQVTEQSLRDQLTAKTAAKAKRDGWTVLA